MSEPITKTMPKLTPAEKRAVRAEVMGLELPDNYTDKVCHLVPNLNNKTGLQLIRMVAGGYRYNQQISEALKKVATEERALINRLQQHAKNQTNG